MARSAGGGRALTERKPPTPPRRRRRSSSPPPPPAVAAGGTDGHLAYTYAGVARELSCSERKVQQLVSDGILEVFYVGPQMPRVSRSALEDFMAKGGAPR
jgi:hypothetical protein